MRFSETYLYKIHALTHLLDKAFDRTLRTHADISLSQLMVLLAVLEHTNANQRQIARYLGISAVAVKRQVDLAKQHCWLETADGELRGDNLRLTADGMHALQTGVQALEQHVLAIFDTHNQSANLMQHLDLLLGNTKELLGTQQPPQN